MNIHLPLLALLAAVTLPSCVVPGEYPGGVSTVGISYDSYSSLPPGYAGDAYFYSGRYYSGGRYEQGRFHDHGRSYDSRYLHHGQYYYGGRHEHHDGPGRDYQGTPRRDGLPPSAYRVVPGGGLQGGSYRPRQRP